MCRWWWKDNDVLVRFSLNDFNHISIFQKSCKSVKIVAVVAVGVIDTMMIQLWYNDDTMMD